MLVGLIGYVAAFLFTDPVRLALGKPGGPLAGLAMPLPLEYVGGAVPAAVYGYVRSRTKQAEAVAARSESNAVAGV